MGSFHHSLMEKKEKLLSMKGGSESGQDEGLIGWRRRRCCSFRAFCNGIVDAWVMGRSDPRKILFAAKMGLALVLISLLIFLKNPFLDVFWGIITVVFVFEFSIGATVSKVLNSGLGSLAAGGLALALGMLSKLAGKWEKLIVMINIFSAGFCATYAKQYPTMKANDFGFREFLITYCFIIVSGYQTGDFIQAIVTRFFFIALGATVSVGVHVCIYPIWAGEDLHNLVAKNFSGVATSLEGVVNNYLDCVEYDRVPSKILTYQAADDDVVYSGYRSVVESTSTEDALLGFAICEPPHGRYRMLKYPWKNYVKVSGALRHCSFMVIAMHGCLLSEIQAPVGKRQFFRNEIKKVGSEGAKVLRELGNKVKNLEKLGLEDILYEVQEAAEELQQKIDKKSFLLVNSKLWEIGNMPKKQAGGFQEDLLNINEERHYLEYKSQSVPRSWEANVYPKDINPAITVSPTVAVENMFRKQISWPAHISIKGDVPVTQGDESKTFENASSLSLATFTSLLIEFVARLQNLVDSFEELGEKANFKDPLQQQASGGCWNRLSSCFRIKY